MALDQRDSMYLGVNRTGALLFPALQAGATREELAARLVQEFGLDPEVAQRDVDSFVDALAAQGLLAPE